jgi:TonB family protein
MKLALLVCCSMAIVPTLPAHGAFDAVEFEAGMVAPKALATTRARYPAAAKDEGVAGTVVVRAVIDRKGRVKDIEIVSSPDKRLSKAAEAAMKMREYAPATRDGEPIAVWWRETFEFRQTADEVAAILACDPSRVEAADPSTDGDVVYPEIVRDVQPSVTDQMLLRREPGLVRLACTVDVCGRVRDCKVLNSNGSDFSRSAIEAAEKRLYRPATKNGKPVAVTMTIRIDFHF